MPLLGQLLALLLALLFAFGLLNAFKALGGQHDERGTAASEHGVHGLGRGRTVARVERVVGIRTGRLLLARHSLAGFCLRVCWGGGRGRGAAARRAHWREVWAARKAPPFIGLREEEPGQLQSKPASQGAGAAGQGLLAGGAGHKARPGGWGTHVQETMR